jgi:mannosylglycoprotein endo-beta-mannosidase
LSKAACASAKEPLDFGVRQLTTSWNTVTHSLQLEVNGQKIFIKGGNWIVSDELLRFTPQRYDAEIRFHRDMNLNLIRVWGGALTERPEFYAACDRYGLLVFQDFWNSGDCNGRWEDPMKKEDQWTRRKYPDDHDLFIASAADQIKMLRNHPSLAFWCGGNEITPPEDILHALKDSLMPALDGTRHFIDYSNSDSMSYNTLGGNGDGPYGIQHISTFWGKKTFPFNSEVGSVGMGDYESLERFLPKEELMYRPPTPARKTPYGIIINISAMIHPSTPTAR